MTETVDIFSNITPDSVADDYTDNPLFDSPFIGQGLFPDTKQIGSDIEYLKGQDAAPKALQGAAFNTTANMRDRQGGQKVKLSTHYYKEGFYIDEQTRQELLRLQNGNNPAYTNFVTNNVFNDSRNLIAGAILTPELARVQTLKTAQYTLSGTQATYSEDFLTPEQRQAGYLRNDLGTGLSDDGRANNTPFRIFQKAIDTVQQNNGAKLTRAIMNTNTLRALLTNNTVKATLLSNNANSASVNIPRQAFLDYLVDEYGINIQVYDDMFKNAAGVTGHFWDDGEITLLPDGELGHTVYSTTPEEADLMGQSDASVAMIGNVAVSTQVTSDPVNKKIIASEMFTPTFEQVDSVYNITFNLSSSDSSNSGTTTTPTSTTTSSDSSKK